MQCHTQTQVVPRLTRLLTAVRHVGHVCGWRARSMSNYDYLMALNQLAGRSFNDLSQYPVMPWIISDYHSLTLDLHDQGTFRDLSKPIGALEPTRLAALKQRFNQMAELAHDTEGETTTSDTARTRDAPFLYGTHYSTPAYVAHFLVSITIPRAAFRRCLARHPASYLALVASHLSLSLLRRTLARHLCVTCATLARQRPELPLRLRYLAVLLVRYKASHSCSHICVLGCALARHASELAVVSGCIVYADMAA